MKQWFKRQLGVVRKDWRRLALFSGIGLLAVIILGQLFYPASRLVPFTTIDNVALGGWKKDDAARQLDVSYSKATIPIYFGNATKAYRSPHLADIGLKASNAARINKVSYPWYLRIVPSSILWAHFVTQPADNPTYTRHDATLAAYITKELGNSCDVKPEDASLKASGDHFDVIPSHSGGTCDITVVKQKLSDVKPNLARNNRVRIPVTEIAASVSDSEARALGDRLQKKIGSGITITAGSTSKQVATKDIVSWTDFQVVDGELTYGFNSDRASSYLTKTFGPSVAVPAGTTKVSTYDFVETARTVGPSGKQLDVTATLAGLKAYIEGDNDQVTAATSDVPPTVTYTRSYSPTDQGFSALLQQYAETHPGTYGISMIELSGQHRRASYHDTVPFTTASTYKLFVAYSTLKRIEDGSWHWTDQVAGGRNLSTCFDDMIVKSDNACAEAMLQRVGYVQITNEAHAIGCTSTSFEGKDGIKSTAADESLLLAELQTGQILSQQSSRDRWIDAMKRNVYRRGIPAGIKGATVADKVGFLDALLHDAAIVYSPTGTYVLVVMTDNASWGNIAELAGMVEALRNQ